MIEINKRTDTITGWKTSCNTCAHREICKYSEKYKNLVECILKLICGWRETQENYLYVDDGFSICREYLFKEDV